MANNIIETFDLTKIYKMRGRNKKIVALDRATISVKKGEIFGFLGPNGAGKTTMIQILTTLIQPTSGYATIDGYNILKKPKLAKSRVALMLQSDMLYNRITAYENLKFFCSIYNVRNAEEKIKSMAKKFELESWLNEYVEKFSSGMKMRLALFRTLLLDRQILFLDEPTLGLDVKSISYIINMIKDSKKTIFLTSHDMSVVEKLCTRIAFINKGKILKIGAKNELKKLISQDIRIEIEINDRNNELKSELENKEYIKEINSINNGFEIFLKERLYYKDLLLILVKYDILKIKEKESTLEELFLQII